MHPEDAYRKEGACLRARMACQRSIERNFALDAGNRYNFGYNKSHHVSPAQPRQQEALPLKALFSLRSLFISEYWFSRKIGF